MKIDPNALNKLNELRDVEKFKEDNESFYPGSVDEETRKKLNQLMNQSINAIIEILNDNPTKEKILEQFKNDLKEFENLDLDTEDRERVCFYYDKIRECIGFDDTNNLLNEWLYGELAGDIKI